MAIIAFVSQCTSMITPLSGKLSTKLKSVDHWFSGKLLKSLCNYYYFLVKNSTSYVW